MQKSAVIHIATTGGIHEGISSEGRLMMLKAIGCPDMASANAIRDDQKPRRATQKLFGHLRQFRTPAGLFREISRNDAQMARLEEITDRLSKAARAAIEGDFDVCGLCRRDGRAAGLFVTSIQMQQAHAIEHRRFKNRLGSLGGHENDLPASISLPHEDHRTSRLAIQ